MDWTATEQGQLHTFLSGFTSPDPAVQASNLAQLEALSQYPAALASTLAVACDDTCGVAVRLSATTVARQLLLRQRHTDAHSIGSDSGTGERLPVYLSSINAGDPSAAACAIAQALLEASLRCSGAPPLRRALSGLVAALLRSLAQAESWPAALSALANVWSLVVHSLLQLTDPSATTVPGQSDAAAPCSPEDSVRAADRASLCAFLFREVCETALSSSPALARWVGGQADECLAVCTLVVQFLQLFERLQLSGALNSISPTHYDTACSVAWLGDVLEAFLLFVETGGLPSAPLGFVECDGTDGFGGTSHSASEGPAAEALRSVSAAVLHVHRTALNSILHGILGPLQLMGEHAAGQGSGTHAAATVATAAPLVAVAMRYVADACQFGVFEPLQSDFAPVALPLLAVFCHAASAAELQYDGAGEPDSVHAAVVACVNCVIEWAKLEGSCLEPHTTSGGSPESRRSRMEECASTIFGALVDAATLPPAAVATTLVEQTTHVPDSAADFLVKSAPGRRRRRGCRDTVDVACGAQKTCHDSAVMCGAGDGEADETADGDEDGVYCADALDAALPDNGTLRQAVAWCAASLSCHHAWLLAAAPLVTRCATSFPPLAPSPALTYAPRADNAGELSAAPPSLADACAMEAVMFVQNELVDSLIADGSIAAALVGPHPGALEHSLATQLQHARHLLSLSAASSSQSVGGTGHVPFCVRAQAARYMGRLSAALLDAWSSSERGRSVSCAQELACAVLRTAGGLDPLLEALLVCLTAEVNKAVQVECMRALDSALTSCLKGVEASLELSDAHSGGTGSELEEESLSDSSTDSGREGAAGPFTYCAAPPGSAARQQMVGSAGASSLDAFLLCVGVAADLPAVFNVLRAAASHLESFQWSVRQATYHLFSDVVPMALRVASIMQATSPATAVLVVAPVRAVTAGVLEGLARHYAALLQAAASSSAAAASSPPLLEMATLLTTMADVTTAMDGGALEPVLPWILQVAHAVLNFYAQHLSAQADMHANGLVSVSSSPPGGAVDMTDMAMVSLDLVSCVCDRMIDRDALLMPTHEGRADHRSESAAEIDVRLLALATTLLHPPAADMRHGGANSAESLPNRCIALLALCQASADHPCRATACVTTSHSAPPRAANDALCEVRRACFAILHDCTFLVAYPASLLRPACVTLAAECGRGGGLPDALGRELFVLCLHELLPADAPARLQHGSAPHDDDASATLARQLCTRSAHSAAASDAWLCLGVLLSLWDQQHWQRTRGRRGVSATPSHSSDSEGGPCAVFSGCDSGSAALLRTRCVHALHGLLATLQDVKAPIAATLRLNMTSAACGLTLLLLLKAPAAAPSPACGTPPGGAAACPELSLSTVSAVLSLASSARVQSYAAGATRGDATGICEAAQVLWCVGRVWQEVATPALPHDALCGLVCAHGRELAKTAVWWTRCAHGAAAPRASPSVLWGALAELWRPLARCLKRAAEAKVQSLTAPQLAALRSIEVLQ